MTHRIKALAGVLCMAAWPAVAQAPDGYDVGMIKAPHMYLPDQISQVVVLISGEEGWGAAEEAEAQHLLSRNVATIGLDLPVWREGMKTHEDDCIYTLSDIEEISRRVQKDTDGDYRLPVIAGRGAGGAMALAIVAQTPPSTIAATVAVDPEAGVTLPDPLCTEAKHVTNGAVFVYGLSPGDLHDTLQVVFTPAAPADGRAHVADLVQGHTGITQTESQDAGDVALSRALDARLDTLDQAEGPLDMPITPMPAKATLDTMAVIYSGDGGWRDLDQQIGLYLQQAGIPVVGVDSLRYFWHERDAQQTADDLSKILDRYRTEWGVKNVLLIGYSFGADILPNTYNLLPQADRDSVVQMTLLALSHQRDYEIHVSGWLGEASGSPDDPVDDLKKMPPGLVQCVFGADDDEDACHSQTGMGYEMVGLTGGHHFDGDYETLTQRIVDGVKRRLGK
ncbi:MAG: AcvB/VirJ family lysyl-phosphatidylglycerol hydrolase [Paracoccaceae bacterium]